MLGLKLNVDAIIDAVAIGSENVMLIGLVRGTCVEAFIGTVETTVGAVRSGREKPGPSPFSRASQDAATIRIASRVRERDSRGIDVFPERKGKGHTIVQSVHRCL